jgi:hypothetical protein
MTDRGKQQVNHPLSVGVDCCRPIDKNKYDGLGGAKSPHPYALSIGVKFVLAI